MPVSPAYTPDPQLPALGPEFADPVAAADFPQTVLRFRNDRAGLKRVALIRQGTGDADLVQDVSDIQIGRAHV